MGENLTGELEMFIVSLQMNSENQKIHRKSRNTELDTVDVVVT